MYKIEFLGIYFCRGINKVPLLLRIGIELIMYSAFLLKILEKKLVNFLNIPPNGMKTFCIKLTHVIMVCNFVINYEKVHFHQKIFIFKYFLSVSLYIGCSLRMKRPLTPDILHLDR